jgi:3-hydroxyacyl-CoA dehydrogenase
VAQALPALVDQDLLAGQSASEVLERLNPVTSLKDALTKVDYMQESAPERLAIKRDLYREIDALAPAEAILASSTSALPPSSFTAELAGRERCLVAHPINPPHLVPLVELVPAPWTRPGGVDAMEKLMKSLGQAPIRLSREINGFVANRLQSAVLAEAFRLIDDDICRVEDIDTAIAQGLGLRWFFIGPMETIDLNAPGGVSDYCDKLGPMYEGLAKEQAVVRPWTSALVAKIDGQRREILPKQSLAERRNWRDRCLAALVTSKRRILGVTGT